MLTYIKELENQRIRERRMAKEFTGRGTAPECGWGGRHQTAISVVVGLVVVGAVVTVAVVLLTRKKQKHCDDSDKKHCDDSDKKHCDDSDKVASAVGTLICSHHGKTDSNFDQAQCERLAAPVVTSCSSDPANFMPCLQAGLSQAYLEDKHEQRGPATRATP